MADSLLYRFSSNDSAIPHLTDACKSRFRTTDYRCSCGSDGDGLTAELGWPGDRKLWRSRTTLGLAISTGNPISQPRWLPQRERLSPAQGNFRDRRIVWYPFRGDRMRLARTLFHQAYSLVAVKLGLCPKCIGYSLNGALLGWAASAVIGRLWPESPVRFVPLVWSVSFTIWWVLHIVTFGVRKVVGLRREGLQELETMPTLVPVMTGGRMAAIFASSVGHAIRESTFAFLGMWRRIMTTAWWKRRLSAKTFILGGGGHG